MSDYTFCSKEHIAEYIENQKDQLCEKISYDIDIKLVIFQIGDNEASNRYIAGKIKDCDQVGIIPILIKLSENISLQDFCKIVQQTSNMKNVYGVIIQKPLPKDLDDNFDKILECIPKDKDIDGFRKDSPYDPCTPKGIIDYIEYTFGDNYLTGKHCVVIGRSELVGRPLAKILLDRNVTVTVCHSKTEHLERITSQADILISAVGKPKFINKSFVKPDAVVIDVGINFDENGKMCGDVDRESVLRTTKYCTPVPCGVGLLTRLALLHNISNSYFSSIDNLQ